jgi:hypothetical protein
MFIACGAIQVVRSDSVATSFEELAKLGDAYWDDFSKGK